MKSLHYTIVYEILPRLAKKLKEEGLISDYDRKQQKVKMFKDSDPLRMNPDLILYTSNGKRILIEVANQKDPKRFIGELIYPKIILWRKNITAALIFVLQPKERETPKRRKLGVVRSLSQIHILYEFLHMPKGSKIVTWPDEDATAYRAMKDFAERFSRSDTSHLVKNAS
jgi:hypothetical protein